MKRNIIILSAAAALIASSCSIKEDRIPCPCWLNIDISPCLRRADEVSLRGWNAEKALFGDMLAVAEWPDGWATQVPKGQVEYTAYSGLRECALSGNALVIPQGCEFDPVWAYNTSIYCEGETASDRVELHKQFACVTVKMREKPEGTLSALVTGTSAGFSLTDLSPVRGEFEVSVDEVSGGYFVFNLPRQFDDWASMEILCDGVKYRTLDLGEMISDTGYDWTAEDLDDIYIGLDFTKTDIEIRIEPWEKGAVYETAPVTVSISGEDFAMTRSSFSWSDTEIRDLQMVVSEDDGTLYDTVYSSSPASLSFRGRVGHHYNVLVAANIGGGIEVRTLEDFLAPRGIDRSEIASGGVPMYSSGDDGITVNPGQNAMVITLVRMLARVDFRVDRSLLATPSGLSVKDVRLHNAASAFTPFSESVSAGEGQVLQESFDYASPSDLAVLEGGGAISLYAFENMQGTLLQGNSDPWRKVPASLGDAAERCTWLEVKCSYESLGRSGDDITYRMYLGADATTNFDVQRNRIYKVTLIPTEDEIYGQRGSWKIESDDWTDRRPVSLAFSQTQKEIYVNGPNAGGQGVWTPTLVVTYADGSSASVAGTLSTSDADVASVSGMTVTGLSTGTALISGSYTEYGITVSTQTPAAVTVTDPLIGLNLSPSELTLTKGSSYKEWTLTAVYPSGDKVVDWDEDAYKAGNPVWEISETTTHSKHQGMMGSDGSPDFSVTTRTKGDVVWPTFSSNYTYEIIVSAASSTADDAHGTLTATYTDGGVTLSARCELGATEASVTGYGYCLSDSSITMETGETECLYSYLITYYSNGKSSRSNANSIWTTSNPYSSPIGNAYSNDVLNTGGSSYRLNIYANRTGSTTITASYTDPDGESHTATCLVTVGDAEPVVTYETTYSLGVTPESLSISEGETAALTATLVTNVYELVNGERTGEVQTTSEDVTSSAAWSVESGSEYVTSQGAGRFSWLSGPGAAIVKASSGEASATAEITTAAHGAVISWETEHSLAINPESQSIAEGGTAEFAATLTTVRHQLSDGVRTGVTETSSQDVTASAVWSIASGSEYVTSQGAGRFSWLSGPGTATIKASSEGVSATAEVTTAAHGAVITWETECSLAISPESQSIAEGGTAEFAATLTTVRHQLSDGVRTGVTETSSQDVTSTATWSVESGSEYVTSEGAGRFSWLSGPGTATVKATFGDSQGSATICTLEPQTPDPVVLESISVEPQSMVLRFANGWFDTYTVTAHYSDGSSADVTLSAAAESPACAIAETGTVNAKAAGSGTVTVSYSEGEVSATGTIDITSLDEWYTVGIQAEVSGGEAGSALCYVKDVIVAKENHFLPETRNVNLAKGEYSYSADSGLKIVQEDNGDMEITVSTGTHRLVLSYWCPVAEESVEMAVTFSRGSGGGSVNYEYE